MEIQIVSTENRASVYALLNRAFPGSEYEALLVKLLHDNGRPIHEWIGVHTGEVIAYIAFTNAYRGSDICGLHLAPMAVAPDFQKQGIGSELLRFAIRQDVIRHRTLFVLGEPAFYGRVGFEPCRLPICPFDTNNAHFLSMRSDMTESFIVGYEPEFVPVAAPPGTETGKHQTR